MIAAVFHLAANPPTGLIAVQESETTVSISWTPPTAGDTVTGYRIFYQPNSSVNVSARVTHYTINNLEPNVTYSITMIALSEHLPSELAGPITPIYSTKVKPRGRSCCELLNCLKLQPWSCPHATPPQEPGNKAGFYCANHFYTVYVSNMV